LRSTLESDTFSVISDNIQNKTRIKPKAIHNLIYTQTGFMHIRCDFRQHSELTILRAMQTRIR